MRSKSSIFMQAKTPTTIAIITRTAPAYEMTEVTAPLARFKPAGAREYNPQHNPRVGRTTDKTRTIKKPPRRAADSVLQRSGESQMSVSALRRCLKRLVVTAPVDRRHLRPHRTQISRQLPPMMNAVIV